jgi:hypothetical protein
MHISRVTPPKKPPTAAQRPPCDGGLFRLARCFRSNHTEGDRSTEPVDNSVDTSTPATAEPAQLLQPRRFA